MNDVSLNDRNLRVAQSVKIRSRQKNSRGRTKKSHDPTWTPPYYLLRKWQESIVEYSGTVASNETSHKACEEKDTHSRNDRKSVLKYTEQQAMSRVFTKILSPAVIITRDKLPKSESSNSRTARQFFVCKAKTGALMKGAASEETISRRRDVKDIERIESEGRFLKESMAAEDEVNESSIQRDVFRYEGARQHKRDEEKKRKTTVAIGGSKCANSTFAKDIFRIDSAPLISATSDNPVQDEAVPFRSYDKKDAECDDDTLKVEDARDCTKVRTSFDLSKVHKKSVEEIVAADVYSDITCSLPGETSEQLLAPVEPNLPSFSVAQASHFANRSGLPISIDIKHFIANKESSSCMSEFDRFFEELELAESCKRIPKNKIHPKNVVESTKRSVITEDWKVLPTLVESPKSIVRTVGSDEDEIRISHEDTRGPSNRKFQVGKNEEDIVTSSQEGLPSTSPREKEVSWLFPYESLKMIDSGRLNSSLATALRDRSTCIPVQPNRSLPLRPVPPMPIPTRNAMVKLPKDSPILKLGHLIPPKSSDRVNGSEGESNVICTSRDQSAEKQHVFEFQNESDSDVIITDNFLDGLHGQAKRKIGNLEGELFKINRKKEKESPEHRNTGENVIKETRSDNRNSKDVNDSLIVNYSNKEKIPPLKLRKVLQGNTEKADRLAKEKKAEEMTNYRIVSGRTPAPISPFTDIPFPGLEIDFSSATLHILEGNVSQVDLTVVSQNSTNVEDKSGDCGKLNLDFHADEGLFSRVQKNATVENSIEDEILSAITQERNNNREMISMQKQQKHYDVAQVISKCPAPVPISVAKRHKISAKATVKQKPLDSKMPITKSNEEHACNLPSMPLLEFEFEEHKKKVKVQSATRKTDDREIVCDDFSVNDNIRASRNESLLPEGDSKKSNEAGSPVYVEDLLLDSSSLESRSTLSLSPRTQEGVNELERLNEQGKQKPGDENSEGIIKDKCRRFEENKMQESLEQQFKIQAMEAAARYQKRIGTKRTYVREEATEHRETMSSDESCCMERDEEQEHEQLYDFKNSSTNSASIVRRSVEEQLQYRRTKLRIMLQELKMQTGLLKKQMESVAPDGFQRGRVQQMINCTEKQAENLTKQLNKLSGEMDTKNKEENKVRCIPQKDPPSPEPPKLSPTLPLIYSRGSSSHLRNSPPVLPRAGLSLVSETYDSASKSTTRQSPSTSACTSLDANRISEPLRRDTVVPSCLANTRNDAPLSDTERLRALNTLMTLVESIPNYAENPQQAASESHFSSQRSVVVGETRPLTGKSIGNMHGEQSAALRYPANVTSLQTSCNLPGSCIQIENPGGANVYRKANGLVEANSAQANSVLSGSFARTSATFDNTAQPIEYGRPVNIGNTPINNNVTTILPVKSNFNGNGTFYQNFGPQDCSVAARTALSQQIPSKITQASAAAGPTIRSSSHRSRASVPGKPTGQSYRAQQLNTKMDTGKLRSMKRSKSDASQKDSSQHTNRQIMSENFPTLGNWVAQMSQQQIPTKSAVKTSSSIPTKLSSDVIAPAMTTLEDPSKFRVPGSDMYKMTATAVDMPMSIKLNNINGRWKNNRWEENSIALQQGFRPTGAAQLYQNNFIGYPYGPTFGYHPLYGYRTFTYPHLHPGSMNPHQVMVDSLNSRLGQNTERLTNLQGTEQFTTEMMKHQILAAAFPNQNINSEYMQPTTIGQSIGPNRTVLHASTQNEQFRIPNAPAMQQPNENSYWLAGQSSLSRFSNNEINQLNNCMAASQMKRNYEAVLLENRNSQIPQTGNSSDPNFPSSKEQSVAIDTSMSSKSLLMNLTKEVMSMERNCGTPHLAKVTHNPSILSTLKCANCGSTGSMFKCLGCELTFYCNESCQEQHWLFHGQKCPKKMPKLKKLA